MDVTLNLLPDSATSDESNVPSDTTRWTRRAVLASAVGIAAGAAPIGRALASDKREQVVDRLLEQMSLRERVAQLFCFQAWGGGMEDAFANQLKAVKPGGIIFMPPNISTADGTKAFVKSIHDTLNTLPPFIAIDQEGGNVIRLAGDPAPGAMELGRLKENDARARARDRARFLTSFGFDVNFAPVADVAYKADSTMYDRSFGSDPRAVASTVRQVVRGSRQVQVMGAAKHFPGHGRTAVDSHIAVPDVRISLSSWKKSDALPFAAAVEAGVEMVMVGHLRYSEWDDRPMSLSKVSVQILRKMLGFQGVIVTDDLGMGALADMDPFEVLDRATNAGMDVFLYTAPPAPWDQMVDHVVQRVRKGEVSRKRIDASVRRVLRLKVDHFGLSGKGDG